MIALLKNQRKKSKAVRTSKLKLFGNLVIRNYLIKYISKNNLECKERNEKLREGDIKYIWQIFGRDVTEMCPKC